MIDELPKREAEAMNSIKLFESKHIRSVWDDKAQRWLFAVVDVAAALTESQNPQVYWRVLKKRLLAEGNETVTACNALKLTAADGKQRLTDVADTEQLLRIIQSIPSPAAEPFRRWLDLFPVDFMRYPYSVIDNPDCSAQCHLFVACGETGGLGSATSSQSSLPFHMR